MKLQNINYENIILIYHICRYIMLPLFTSYRKSEICYKYLRMLSRMKAAYIFYFQFSFQEIHKHVCHNSRFSDYLHVLKVSVVDHEGHSIHLKIVEVISFQCFYLHQHLFYIPFDMSMWFPIYNISFYRKCRRNYFYFNISLIELL